ncbi:helix-turn-helix domain-containing protein [Lapidilactobacillus luobeiensis]|uniref:helix-turn-helix domain-containing protein n=1 Tax=Lapidilactobacillus luobeiensis TaxID=2950371 RepID=UPI0021C4A71C|nr:RodZ domain-containing protein [Lapidilactobacillus luobeiensis]
MDEVGKKLRSARIEKGYTLDDLQQITKIQKRYLIAIEEGNFDQLPGDFYVRAFIKQYAETVGLDSHELLSDYRDTIPETQPQEYAENSIENKKRTLHDETNSFGYWLRNNTGKIIIGVVIVIVVASLYFFAVRAAKQRKAQIPDNSSALTSSIKSQSSSQKSSTSKKDSSSSKSSSQSSSSSSKKATLKVTESGTNAFTITGLSTTETNQLTIGASSSSAWVQVTFPNDSSSSWQSVLTAGGSHQLTIPAGTTSFTLQSGNTPATTLKVNDLTVSLPTGTSVVQTFTFTVAADESSSSVSQ